MSDEHILGVDCFGSRCTIAVTRSERSIANALGAAQFLLECHDRLSRFMPRSELSRLNSDPREAVPVSPLMRDFVTAARRAADGSGGLVDPTVLPALRLAGYVYSLPTGFSGPLAGDEDHDRVERRDASPDPAALWRAIEVDHAACVVHRPPGTEIDSGGIAKGWAADRAARMLGPAATFAVECAGDVRVGGNSNVPREILIGNPFGGDPVDSFEVTSGGIATSGTGKRSWRGPDGTAAHHLIDPGTGTPCFTGVVQATALAPTAEEAEMRAKAAILSGPDGAHEWLPHGGLVVLDDRTTVKLAPARAAATDAVAA